MQSHLAHLNQHQSTAFDKHVHQPHLVHSVAKAAMSKIEGADALIEKHFVDKPIYSDHAPKKVFNQPMYMPY